MNNRNKGNGYPENIILNLFGLGFVTAWTVGALKNGAPVFFIVPGLFGGIIMTIGLVNSLKAYSDRRRNSVHDMSGRNYPDENWEKVYTSPNKTVYKKGNMTFTSKGSPIVGVVSGVVMLVLIVKNIAGKFQGTQTGNSLSMLILFLIASAVGLFVDFKRLADRKQDKQDFIDRLERDENMRNRRRESKSMRYFTEKDWQSRSFEDEEITFYCPYCDGRLEQSFDYCPHCGNRLHN